ncbi:restriction endonuclease subunit S [Brachyspira pilosicoli]|uniref:restriction endonuclease subunit S n=2 Tax=Brachyspira pilosicoli TaxID=52584 RepID=UPI0012F4B4CE|nr:restriction endonuclease subunit S [Brachyspira pilosicoli]
MSVFEELLKKHCPDGVAYKTLSEIGEFSNIGVDKKKVDGEKEILLLNFIDVMKNMYIDKSIPKMVVTASDYKIEKCTIEEGDIFITPSSETIDEIGFASVITETIPNACYSYHIMRFRLFEYNMTTSIFIRYCFDSSFLRKQIRKSAQGITRFGLTLNKWKSLKIPFPPIEVQKEIVRILDEFTEKTIKLQELLHRETILRKKQYEYYRDKLLTFNDDVEWKCLGELLQPKGYIRGPFGSALKKDFFVKDGVPVYEQQHAIYNKRVFRYFVDCERADKLKRFTVKPYDIIISCSGTIGKISIIMPEDRIGIINQALLILRLDLSKVNVKYIKHYLECFPNLIVTSSGGAITNIEKREIIEKIKIPIPPLKEQERIVKILDQFDTLCNDITRGLPAEIELRKKQYEYYRDKLLTFKEKKK